MDWIIVVGKLLLVLVMLALIGAALFGNAIVRWRTGWTSYGVSMPVWLEQEISKEAERRGVRPDELVRDAINHDLARHGPDGSPQEECIGT